MGGAESDEAGVGSVRGDNASGGIKDGSTAERGEAGAEVENGGVVDIGSTAESGEVGADVERGDMGPGGVEII